MCTGGFQIEMRHLVQSREFPKINLTGRKERGKNPKCWNESTNICDEEREGMKEMNEKE